MRVHNNEIILSWLRTEDSYYGSDEWHLHDIELKYDETGHWSECECGYKEEPVEHALDEWSTVPVNDGEKDVVVRRCPCGYEETKKVAEGSNLTGTVIKPVDTMSVVLICIGTAVIVAASVVMVVVSKKRKSVG